MTPVGVLAVDHQDTGLRALRSIVAATAGFAWTGEAHSAEEAAEAAVQLRPRMALVASDLPAIDGAETAQLLHDLLPRAKVAVIGAGEELTPRTLRALWDGDATLNNV
jgi:DNA-binding NarL/FixJ family response regulator